MTSRAAPRYDRAMKTRNVVLSAVLAVALAAGGAAWWLFLSLDGLVKQAIQHWGPEITGVAVRVDSVKIEVAEGRGTIRGLYVGNPKGFDAPHALTLGEMRLTLDPASITKDVVVIRELLVAAPDVVYERGHGSDNLSVIQKNIDAWVAKNAGAKKSEGPGKKFVIEHVIIKDGRAHFGTAVSAPMPDLHLHDVGKKSNGATAGEVVKQVWGAMLHSAGNLASQAGAAIKEGAARVGESVKKLFK
jgi:hypothetical protein